MTNDIHELTMLWLEKNMQSTSPEALAAEYRQVFELIKNRLHPMVEYKLPNTQQ